MCVLSYINIMSQVRIFLILLLSIFTLGISIQPQTNSSNPIDSEMYDISKSIYLNVKKTHPELPPVIAFIDYRLPSNHKRLWIFDIDKKKILVKTYVSHGKGSGRLLPSHFSNRSQSYETSLGAHITGKTYVGKHGLSLKLIGLEDGINDHSESRGIVLHSAWYASSSFLHDHGYLGRSLGCPAVSQAELAKIINLLKNGHLLIQYSSDDNYLSSTQLIDSTVLKTLA
ncbi:MAG TPA: murein L,D-transpeptidase catalytic domain family protein [Gammaproteobacteria bacterium]|nr:murein L,D-transpeptidase catalytic domain family protein [Gammaproteobacteria bacterium]